MFLVPYSKAYNWYHINMTCKIFIRLLVHSERSDRWYIIRDLETNNLLLIWYRSLKAIVLSLKIAIWR
jgi:hypothetical protein